jgi:hypothetical protein
VSPFSAADGLYISTPPRGDKTCRAQREEEELETSIKHCSAEPSPQELQIRALKQVMSILRSHAQESRKRVARLRTVLADRQAEPGVYENFQRERWMEEKRQLVVDEETKVVLQHLEALNNDDTRPLPVPNPRVPISTTEARRDANLLMFLASTQTRAPIRTYRSTSAAFHHTLRRRTIDKVTPMVLRSSFTSPALVGPAKVRSRAVSLHGAELARQPRRKSSDKRGVTASVYLPHNVTSASVVAEDTNWSPHEPPLSDSSSTDISHMPLLESHVSTPLTFASSNTCHILQPLTLTKEEESQDHGGTATIYRAAPHHLSDDVLADLHVSLPDYALDLLSHFDQSQMATLKSITFLFSTPPAIIQRHTSTPSSSSTHDTSAALQVPTPVSKPSDLRHKPSYRNLFSIPQVLSSCTGVDDSPRSGSSGRGFLSRSRQPRALSSQPSTASLGSPTTENVTRTKKIKNRWSVLRR